MFQGGEKRQRLRDVMGVVAEARRSKWPDENADAFARQAEWHERNGHPLAEILVSPGKASWIG